MVVKVSGVETSKNIRLQQRVTTKSVKKKLSKLIEITPRLETRREMKKRTFSRPRRGREFCKMIFRDQDETETRNLDREIKTETRVSSNPDYDGNRHEGGDGCC